VTSLNVTLPGSKPASTVSWFSLSLAGLTLEVYERFHDTRSSELYPDMSGIDRFKLNSDGIFVYKIMAFRLFFVAYSIFFSEYT
jgi:hypothetical protein